MTRVTRWCSAVAFVALFVAGCGSDEADRTASTASTTTTTTVSVSARIHADLKALHTSRIREVPRLIALFYHSDDGWAVEDTSLDDGATWCRHAWYRWTIENATSPNDFVVRYHPMTESPDCVPLGTDLVMHVTRRTTRDGRTIFSGEYSGASLHFERTVCDGTIDDYGDVCGVSSGLGAPTATPTPG